MREPTHVHAHHLRTHGLARPGQVSVFEGSMVLANAASGCVVLGDMDEHIWNEHGQGELYKVPPRVCFV